MLRTNTGMILSVVNKGDFSLEAFRGVHRPLPPASGHMDSSPSAKDVAVAFEKLTKLPEKEVSPRVFLTESIIYYNIVLY